MTTELNTYHATLTPSKIGILSSHVVESGVIEEVEGIPYAYAKRGDVEKGVRDADSVPEGEKSVADKVLKLRSMRILLCSRERGSKLLKGGISQVLRTKIL